MKPNWKDAPVWAMFLARDHKGVWKWYECEPAQAPLHEGWQEVDATRVSLAMDNNWVSTLKCRPPQYTAVCLRDMQIAEAVREGKQ